MSGAEAVRQALDALEQTLHDIERVAVRTDTDRRRDLIEQRRALSARMTEVQQRGVGPGSPFAADEALQIEFQRYFSKVRNAVALHQATWSVVLIDDAPAGYLESSRAASAALREFIAWSREALRTR